MFANAKKKNRPFSKANLQASLLRGLFSGRKKKCNVSFAHFTEHALAYRRDIQVFHMSKKSEVFSSGLSRTFSTVPDFF